MKTIHSEQALRSALAVSLAELLKLFFQHNKVDTQDTYGIRKAFALLYEMFKTMGLPIPDTATFKPGYLVGYQLFLVEKNQWARSEVVRKFKYIKRVLRWAGAPRYDKVTWDKVDAFFSSAFIAEINAIKLIDDISKCRKNEERFDVPWEYFEAIFPHLPPHIAAMLRIQLLMSLRPCEVCGMTAGRIKKTLEEFGPHRRFHDGENWLYVLDEHKTVDHIGTKLLPINLEAQAILKPYIEGEKPDAFVFTRITWKGFGEPLNSADYGRYIKRAIDKHGLPKFTAYQARHTGLSQADVDSNEDTARTISGHTTTAMTRRYLHRDLEKVMAYDRERMAVGAEGQAGGDAPNLRVFSED